MRVLAGLAVVLAALPAPPAQERDFSTVTIQATKVGGTVWMLQGSGGNIGASVGSDGVLIVDDQFAPLAPKIRAKLDEIGPGKLRFVLNTHWHGDHVGGNRVFGREATIVAHDNVRARLAQPQERFGEVDRFFPRQFSAFCSEECSRSGGVGIEGGNSLIRMRSAALIAR